MKVTKIKQSDLKPKDRLSFECAAILGLGITSVIDFVHLCEKYKAIREVGIQFYTIDSSNFVKKAKIQVFSSVKDVFRFSDKIMPYHVVVISEVPTILKEIPNLIPLDYDQNRSFEFNFKEIDVNLVRQVIKLKNVVSSKLLSQDVLGYHVDRVKNTGGLITSFIALTSNLPFDSRTTLRKALFKFFQTKKADSKIVTSVVKDLAKVFKIKDQSVEFIQNFEKEAQVYHQAVNDSKVTSLLTLANQYNIDMYTLSYMKRLIRTLTIVNTRNSKSNVLILG